LPLAFADAFQMMIAVLIKSMIFTEDRFENGTSLSHRYVE
jgi:hypothetical protein